MHINFRPVDGDVQYLFAFKNPLVSFLIGESRNIIIEKCLNLFSLRIADLIFQTSLGSNNIFFKKFYDRCILEVSLGGDDVTATIRNPDSVEQVHDLLEKVVSMFESEEFAIQKITIRRQLSTDDDIDEYLNKMVPNVPEKLSDNISSRGFIHSIVFNKLNLRIRFMIEKSVTLEKGIFQYIDFYFSPNSFDFTETFKIVSEKYNFINAEFGLIIEEE